MNKFIKKILDLFGFKITRKRLNDNNVDLYVELSSEEKDIIRYITNNNLSMSSLPRLINTVKSCVYVVENNIEGDFVECGVWRGGNSIAAKKIFELLGSKKEVWLFDTFAGMTKPTEYDVDSINHKNAIYRFNELQRDDINDWCYASLEDVKANFKDYDIDMSGVNFIKGDVLKTIDLGQRLPDKISVLRLDTDWYESTRRELEFLYPKISKKGVLVIDDYGGWQGSKKAVDEYFFNSKYKPLLNVIDYTGRSAIKPE